MTADRRTADAYRVTEDERDFFLAHGYLVLRGVVAAEEMAPIETVLETLRRGEVGGMGKDFCDMSGALSRRPEDFALINAMLPRVYVPAIRGNAFERRALAIARANDTVNLDTFERVE